MDPGHGRKRPWEDDSPVESHFRRRDPYTAAVFDGLPPLPQLAGYYSRDSETLSRRTLPPLDTVTPSCNASAVSVSTTATQNLPSTVDSSFRPRSQSLFNISLQPVRQGSYDTDGKVAFPIPFISHLFDAVTAAAMYRQS
jgi:hypothetical protein